jgi:phage terminase small subunit
MEQRGRKSAAALSVVPIVERLPRLHPPASLSKGESDLFRQVVAQCSADHFAASDTPLLVAYCQAVLLSRLAFKRVSEEGDAFQIWQQAARTLATLATKLRLCPHSRTDPKTVGRRSRGFGITADDYLDMVTSDERTE